MSVLNEVVRLFAQYVDLKARQYTTGAIEETRRIVAGVLLFAAGGVFWLFSFIFFFAALFFRLAPGLAGLAPAAVWTGLCAAAVAAIVSLIAYRRTSSRPLHHRREMAAARSHSPDDGELRR